MSPPPRRLSFAVGTTLLSVSLATGVVGCKKATVNEGPEPPTTDGGDNTDHTVNVANTGDEPVDTPDEDADDTPTPEEGPHVNTVPDGST